MELEVASPCPMSWDKMSGDDRVRFCGSCRLNVYNLTVMSPEEIADLVREKGGRFCGRIYRRPDGTALAQDCPVGRTRKILRRVAAVAAVLLAATAAVLILSHSDGRRADLPDWLQTVLDWIHPRDRRPPDMIMGKMIRPN